MAVYAQEGENARVGHKEINSMRTVVVASSYESEERSKEGIEYEQNTFLETFKDQPDVIKKAKYHPVRVRDPKTKAFKVELRTKVYDLADGMYRFKEKSGSEIRQNCTIDDGPLSLVEDQQRLNYELALENQFEHVGGVGGLTMEAVGLGGSSSSMGSVGVVTPKSSKHVKVEEAADAEESDDDDDETPAQRSSKALMEPSPKKPKATAKPKGAKGILSTAASGGASVGGAGAGGDPSGGDRNVALLLEEADKEFAAFKDKKDLNSISEEALVNLAKRLQDKKNWLVRKNSKKGGDALTAIDSLAKLKGKVQSISDVLKASATFDKKQCRKSATALLDKYHAMSSQGVASSDLPACMVKYSLRCNVAISASDRKFK